jgi:hypothetical protein
MEMPKLDIVWRISQYKDNLTRQQKRHDWKEVVSLLTEAQQEIEHLRMGDNTEIARLRTAIENARCDCPILIGGKFQHRRDCWKREALKEQA